MSDQVVIDRRFRGPPDSANGGYVCGMLAAAVDPGAAGEVTLLLPPPLDRPLSIDRDDGEVRLLDVDAVVATAARAPAPEPQLPDPVVLAEAARAREGSPMQRDHPYPMCFVCGPDRAGDDGLAVTCGPVPGREDELVAAPFHTDAWMAAEGGDVRPELVWSVLDCPSGISAMLVPSFGKSVLGRMSASIATPLVAGDDYVAIGWPIERDGRKFTAGSAIFDEKGRAMAVAEALWIELREQPRSAE